MLRDFVPPILIAVLLCAAWSAVTLIEARLNDRAFSECVVACPLAK